MSIADQLTTAVQDRINVKRFDYYEETGVSHDWLGNLSAKRLEAKGETRGSTVEVVDAARPLLKVILESWVGRINVKSTEGYSLLLKKTERTQANTFLR